MGAHAIGVVAKVAPPVGGAMFGVLLENYHGQPAWLVFLGVTISLAFGIASSVGRSKDKAQAISSFKYNAGTLWTIACLTAWRAHLDIPTAMLTALATGIVGSPIIDLMLKIHDNLTKS